MMNVPRILLTGLLLAAPAWGTAETSSLVGMKNSAKDSITFFTTAVKKLAAEKQRRLNAAKQYDSHQHKTVVQPRRLDAHLTMNLLETAEDAGDFGTLLAALKAVELESALAGDEPLTIMAPNDAAFAKAFELLDTTPEDALANPALKDILLYHALEGKVMAADVMAVLEKDGSMEAKTLQGESFTLKLDGDSVKVHGGDIVPAATVITPDVEATNGVAHVIDMVLFPPTISAALKGGGGGGAPAGMEKCMEACPDMAKMGEMEGDMAKMCPVLTCVADAADCKAFAGSMGEETIASLPCMCAADMIAMMSANAEAEAGKGVCKDAVKDGKRRRLEAHEEKGEGDLDVCAVAGDCKAIVEKAAKMIIDDAKCATMKKGMMAESSDADKKCIEDLAAAAPAADGGGEGSVDGAVGKAKAWPVAAAGLWLIGLRQLL